MKYESQSLSIAFSSQTEVESFHLQLSALLRAAMIQATCAEADADRARQLSQAVIKEFPVLVRALNALRSSLPRKKF